MSPHRDLFAKNYRYDTTDSCCNNTFCPLRSSSFSCSSAWLLKVLLSRCFFYLLLIYLRLAGCLTVTCFLIWKCLVREGWDWTVKRWRDDTALNFSSLNLSIRMKYLSSPSPRPCFGLLSSSSLPLWFYLVLVLVLSSPPPLLLLLLLLLETRVSFEDIFWTQFVSGWTCKDTKHRQSLHDIPG